MGATEGRCSESVGASGPGPRELARRLLGSVAGKDVLELGAGNGSFARELVDAGAAVTGVDLVDQWREPGVPFHRADIDERLPFRDASFDTVVCLEALNFVDSVPHVFREARRVLRPGGAFVVTFPNCLSLESRIKFLLSGSYRWFPHRTYAGGDKADLHDWGRDPVRVSTAALIAGMADFDVVDTQFGGSRLGPGWLLPAAAACTVQNAAARLARASKRPPPCVLGLPGLMHRNVGLTARAR